jgi:mannose-6-phosphate isomerase-like protein (cupin superfamily)
MQAGQTNSERRSATADAGSEWFRERLAQVPATASRTTERVAVIESATLSRGTMPPLHAHDRDESYRVLEGEVVFYVGHETVVARDGDVVVAPKGVPRTFLVTSVSARWLVMTTLRSLARYDDFTRGVARPARSRPGEVPTWPSAEEAAAVAAIAAANGIELLGPPGMLPSEL